MCTFTSTHLASPDPGTDVETVSAGSQHKQRGLQIQTSFLFKLERQDPASFLQSVPVQRKMGHLWSHILEQSMTTPCHMPDWLVWTTTQPGARPLPRPPARLHTGVAYIVKAVLHYYLLYFRYLFLCHVHGYLFETSRFQIRGIYPEM